VPTLLIPPELQVPEGIMHPTNNAVIVAAADDLEGLKNAFNYAVTDTASPGDAVYVMHIVKPAEEKEMEAVRKETVKTVLGWQEENPAPHAMTLNVAVQVITSPVSDMKQQETASITQEEELEPDFSPAAHEVCEYATQLNVKSVVLAHHGQNFMREMIYKPATVHCIRHCSRPLLILCPKGTGCGY